MRAELYIEDTEDGSIAFRSNFLTGFSNTSPAHKLAVQVIKWLDEQAAQKTIIEVEPPKEDLFVEPVLDHNYEPVIQ